MSVETITYVDPDGGETLLTDLRGITGRGHPPVAFNDLVVPQQPGSVFRSVRDEARQVVVPILLTGESKVDYRQQLRALAASLHPSSLPGLLRVATVDGETRELSCWYVDGFGWLEEMPDWSTPSLLFRACDPYWYDESDIAFTFTAGESSTFFPFFPLRLVNGSAYSSETIDNTGDVDAWPVWTVHGPGSSLALRNATTGKDFELDYTLAATDVLTVDTRPGYKTVTLQDDSSLFSSIGMSSLWPLARGVNAVDVELSDATDDSEVSMRYKRRRLCA